MRSLDRCLVCEVGSMRVYKTFTTGLHRRRYLKCDSCGQTGKEWFAVDHLGRPQFQNLITSVGTSVTTNFPSSPEQ